MKIDAVYHDVMRKMGYDPEKPEDVKLIKAIQKAAQETIDNNDLDPEENREIIASLGKGIACMSKKSKEEANKCIIENLPKKTSNNFHPSNTKSIMGKYEKENEDMIKGLKSYPDYETNPKLQELVAEAKNISPSELSKRLNDFDWASIPPKLKSFY